MSYTITVNIVTQNNATSTVPVAKYVYGLDTNPTTIAEGGSATLNFVADGVYFMFLKAKALAAKVSGASFTWTSADPYTKGQLVLSNPTSDVEITLNAKVNVIPQEVARPFLIKKNFPDNNIVYIPNDLNISTHNQKELVDKFRAYYKESEDLEEYNKK